MTRRGRWLAALTAGLAATVLVPLTVSAHPLGNFTVNHYSGIEVVAHQVRVHYVLDLAEIPSFQERQRIADSPHYLDTRVAEIAAALTLTVDGTSRPLQPVDQQMRFLPGQAGLETLRIEALLAANVAGDGEHSATYGDANDPGRIGWREITVRATGGAQLRRSDAPSTSVTNELRAYPQDMLSSPLDVGAARFAFVPGAAGTQPARLGAIGGAFGSVQDRFAALITPGQVSWSFVLFALAAAVGLGAAHALSPGHGKTVVAAYMVGSRRNWHHAVVLGTTITATHTAGVFALGLITLYASSLVTPEQLYPWLTLASGLLILLMGAWLVFSRVRSARRRGAAHHDHGHGGGHHHHHEHTAGHTHEHATGASPTPSLGRRGVVLLGISGGLLPCPSALLVLLAAISAHRVAFGLLLIVAFSAGLAAVLVGIGITVAHGTALLRRLPRHSTVLTARAARLLPIASAVVVCVAGVGLVTQALPSVR